MNFDYIINWHYKNFKDCYFISLGIVIEASARTCGDGIAVSIYR